MHPTGVIQAVCGADVTGITQRVKVTMLEAFKFPALLGMASISSEDEFLIELAERLSMGCLSQWFW